MTGTLTLEDLREAVDRGEIDTVVVCFPDMQGRLVGKRITMVEIRNDEIASEADQRRWAERLATLLLAAERDLAKTKHAMV